MHRKYTKTDVILPSTQQNAAYTSPQQFNNGYVGLRLDLDITALSGTSPTVTYIIESYDEGKKAWVTELQSAAQGSATHLVMHIDPRIPAAANLVRQMIVPRRWRIRTTLGGTSPTVTHSIMATYGQ